MLVIIDYGMGNLGSIANMLRRLNAPAQVSSKIADIEAASALILPGVGAFDHGMQRLRESGIERVLRKKVLMDRTPILGICLGMQLFTRRSEEGDLPGLGWIDGETKRFDVRRLDQRLKVPHMGWNLVEPRHDHPLFEGDAPFRFYFVHSYHVCCENADNVLAVSYFGRAFTAAICKDNILGVQFHPEKSHRYGLTLLANYVRHCRDVSTKSDPLSAFAGRRAG